MLSKDDGASIKYYSDYSLVSDTGLILNGNSLNVFPRVERITDLGGDSRKICYFLTKEDYKCIRQEKLKGKWAIKQKLKDGPDSLLFISIYFKGYVITYRMIGVKENMSENSVFEITIENHDSTISYRPAHTLNFQNYYWKRRLYMIY